MVSSFVLSLFLDMMLGIGVFYFFYLVTTRNFFHFLDKKRLVNGDLVFIKYRGKYRKAYVKSNFHGDNKVQLEFADNKLNIDLIKANWYPFHRLILPDYLSPAAKILYSESED